MMGHYLVLGLIILTFIEGSINHYSIFYSKYIVFPGRLTSALTGIQFGDNEAQNYVTEENGVAVASAQVFKNLLILSLHFL